MRDAERLQVLVADREADDDLVGGRLEVLDAEQSVQSELSLMTSAYECNASQWYRA